MALDDVSGNPAPTPAASPKAKKKKRRSGMTEHEHLIDLDRAIEKVLKLYERQDERSEREAKRIDRLELMLELVCEHVGIKPPPRVA
jgi:hypothetical protein